MDATVKSLVSVVEQHTAPLTQRLAEYRSVTAELTEVLGLTPNKPALATGPQPTSQRPSVCFMCGGAYGQRSGEQPSAMSTAKCGHSGLGWFCHSAECSPSFNYTDKRCRFIPADNKCHACHPVSKHW